MKYTLLILSILSVLVLPLTGTLENDGPKKPLTPLSWPERPCPSC